MNATMYKGILDENLLLLIILQQTTSLITQPRYQRNGFNSVNVLKFLP